MKVRITLEIDVTAAKTTQEAEVVIVNALLNDAEVGMVQPLGTEPV